MLLKRSGGAMARRYGAILKADEFRRGFESRPGILKIGEEQK